VLLVCLLLRSDIEAVQIFVCGVSILPYSFVWILLSIKMLILCLLSSVLVQTFNVTITLPLPHLFSVSSHSSYAYLLPDPPLSECCPLVLLCLLLGQTSFSPFSPL
jgi:hypothetical protein